MMSSTSATTKWGRSVRMTGNIERYYRVAEPAAAQQAMQTWFRSPAGNALLQAERESCRALATPAGFRLAHLGVTPGFGVGDCFPQPHRFSLVAAPGPGADGVVCFDNLPLPSDTLDVVVLHHALDFSRHPHAVLTEAARALRPGGRLVLLGLNPYAPFGLSKWIAAPLSDANVWRHNSLRRSRVTDWLTLLGFAVNSGAGSGLPRRWPLLRRGLAFYLVNATKRAIPVQPLPPRPWLRAVALGSPVAVGRARAANNRRQGVA